MVGLIAVVCGDIGMCVIYLFLFVTISWMAGVKARWFALGGTCFVGAILGAWFTILQSDRFAYIRNRFMVVLDHSLDPLGAGFQQSRSPAGHRLGPAHRPGIPQRHPDSGIIQCRSPCPTDRLHLLRLRGGAWHGGLPPAAPGPGPHHPAVLLGGPERQLPFSAYVSMGIAGMLLAQVFFNVGMCLYILPVMGLTLPFFQLWRLLHHHPLHRHGHRLQHPGQDPPQLASGPEPALTLADPRSRR